MRLLAVLVACLLTGVAVYAVPTGVELLVLHLRVSPWITCVLFGDLTGCAVLFALGFKRMSVALYLVAIATKASLLALHVLPANKLLWVTDMAPAALLTIVVSNVVLRGLLDGQSEV